MTTNTLIEKLASEDRLIFVTLVYLSFVLSWNDSLWHVLMTLDGNRKTLRVTTGVGMDVYLKKHLQSIGKFLSVVQRPKVLSVANLIGTDGKFRTSACVSRNFPKAKVGI